MSSEGSDDLVGYSGHDAEGTYLGDGEWLVRSAVKGTSQKPNRRRIIARRNDDRTIELVEQMAFDVKGTSDHDPHWKDVDSLGEIAWSSTAVTFEVIDDV